MILRHRRPGVTLTEALIAVFIMAIGLIALLSLFPVGALQMAEAFKNERATQLANNADNFSRMMWKAAWNDPTTSSLVPELTAFTREPGLRALDNPWSNQWPLGQPTPVAFRPYDVDPSNVTLSWSVYMDPIGVSTQAGNGVNWVAGQVPVVNPNNPNANRPGVPRRTIQVLPTGSAPARQRLLANLDDLGFTVGGDSISATGDVDRGGRYNCSWLIQRLKNNVRNEVNVHVVVYSNRPVADTALKEYSYDIQNPALFQPAPNGGTISVQIINPTATVQPPLNGQKLPLKRGGWVMIAGIPTLPPPAGIVPPLPIPVPVAEFYRVTALTQDTAGNILLDLQSPVRQLAAQGLQTGNSGGYRARLFVLEGVVEVFDRGTMSATAPPAP